MIIKHKLMLFVVSSIFLLGGCTSISDFEKGKNNLEQQGYLNVKNTGWKYFCCSENEPFRTGFIANDKKGSTIKGCFCSHFLKGIIIRYE